ncbi:low-specificity L-threonine aldolase [Aggregatilineales bacterium SYSU G02658]
MNTIDLRSDTVSHPTPAMREAMAKAEVGDDVYGDDPTVNQLEQDAADMFGFEAGLFVASGTQGNLVSLLTHCERGTEAIIGDKSHIFRYEAGGIAAVGGIMPHTVPVQPDGTLRLQDIRAAIRGDNQHFPRTRLITIENTQNAAGGVALPPQYVQSVAALAKEHGLKFHIDGARIFNAAAAYDVPVAELVRGADSVTFCLSKALCAPVGSVVVGSRAFIAEARRKRKMLGGGMRQAGVLAAAGLIALHEMSKRLHEDHVNAAYLADSLSTVPHLHVVSQHTNFVLVDLTPSAPFSADELARRLKLRGILISGYPNEPRIRLVTHYWITRESIDTLTAALKEALNEVQIAQ